MYLVYANARLIDEDVCRIFCFEILFVSLICRAALAVVPLGPERTSR